MTAPKNDRRNFLKTATAVAGSAVLPRAGLATLGLAAPAIVLADDAHTCHGTMIHRLLDRCRRRRPTASLVLAGHGRLLSLIARDANLERAVLLRAVLRPFSPAETRRVLDTMLACPDTTRPDDAVIHTIHELAAGIPATVARLAELVGVVAASRPDGSLSVRDVEAIHRRLCLHAA